MAVEAVAVSTNILPAAIQLSELVEAVAVEPEKLDFQMHHLTPAEVAEVELAEVAEAEVLAAQVPQELSRLNLYKVPQ
jgi:hypothetical protein